MFQFIDGAASFAGLIPAMHPCVNQFLKINFITFVISKIIAIQCRKHYVYERTKK